MTADIRWEFAAGQNLLPAAYSGLFIGKFQYLLKYDGITKSKWLSSAWKAWDWVMITEGLGGWKHN